VGNHLLLTHPPLRFRVLGELLPSFGTKKEISSTTRSSNGGELTIPSGGRDMGKGKKRRKWKNGREGRKEVGFLIDFHR